MIPKATGIRKEEWNNEEVDIQLGAIHVLNDKVDEVKRRSGRNGAFIYNWERDETTSILPLPRRYSLQESIDTTDKLALLSRGVIMTKMGYALRIPKYDDAFFRAKALIDPRLAEAVGDELMNARDDVGEYYEIKNIDSTEPYLTICNMFNHVGWRIRPTRFLKPTKPNRNIIMLVFAMTAPPANSFPLGGTKEWIEVVAHQSAKHRLNPWKTAFAELQKQPTRTTSYRRG
jgi:hypothetical protein